ncbi:MAG: TetR family transcriptional regulator [Flavipsychrobacter sp.]|nr:TetR family transcriptional regulator [Flavipsychrobacter sp.]
MRIRDTNKVELVKQKAIGLFAAGGIEGFSMNKLAKACDISVATLYIYYKDKDDLIIQIAMEEGKRMHSITLKDFDPELPFADGLRLQWKNRAKFMMEHPLSMSFFEQLRSSTYHDKVMGSITGDFKEIMGKFTKNAIERGELMKLPVEVYWSVAFAPLYSLLRFNSTGTSLGGKPFTLNDKILWQTFDLVIKALKP